MKNVKKRLFLSVFVVMVAAVFCAVPLLVADGAKGPEERIDGKGNEISPMGTRSVEELQQRLQEMRAVIERDGDEFTVDLNPSMQYEISDLCTLNPEMVDDEDYLHEDGFYIDIQKDGVSHTDALPSYYMGYYTPPRDQKSCGSCWAFGIVGALESRVKKVYGGNYDFSEEYLLDCNTYGYSCNGGYFSAHNNHKSPYGARYESCYPYVGVKGTCYSSSCSVAIRISSWYYVGGSSSVPTTSSIKNAIYSKGAVAAAVYVDYYFQAYSGGTFTRNASGSPNHAILLVGWDDARGAWRLKNSWNTTWGEGGYMWIKYGVQKVGYGANYVNL